ncbi:carboxypeptidase-like regulatory domain-containing protein [Blastopirellula sp. JC732]|uniref:Carboxypeptidase-like regulatory domain-containing protein n=1 Tax=Blastopirellula sediminis TaxID=2894196 RepID=A0A9X1SHL0_9BACT|nr:carboxypeptidase-like regulatory domain-containing protein [Blastopirellula sediminis]MCC9607923.1 carboxypeptidase-like regulatory domain-containing protein [Blastopirellula sediminis]MCC9627284.1 carboxypeptidase-like regulatory domain-containing protein [Blastopirellula sediminis]
MNTKCVCLTVAFLSLFAGACSQRAVVEKLVDVSGKITINGKPCREAEVTFKSPYTRTMGRGVTNSKGEFTVVELMPGEYTVSVLRMSMDAQGIAPGFEIYAGNDSPLQAIVTEDQTTFEFTLGM